MLTSIAYRIKESDPHITICRTKKRRTSAWTPIAIEKCLWLNVLWHEPITTLQSSSGSQVQVEMRAQPDRTQNRKSMERHGRVVILEN